MPESTLVGPISKPAQEIEKVCLHLRRKPPVPMACRFCYGYVIDFGKPSQGTTFFFGVKTREAQIFIEQTMLIDAAVGIPSLTCWTPLPRAAVRICVLGRARFKLQFACSIFKIAVLWRRRHRGAREALAPFENMADSPFMKVTVTHSPERTYRFILAE
jgi:hypothetical protein